MLSRKYPKEGQFSNSARRHLQHLQQMKESDRWVPFNVLQQSQVQRYSEQEPMNTSIVKKLDLLQMIQNDYAHRRSYLDQQIASSSLYQPQKKSSNTLSTQLSKAKQDNELMKLKIVEMEKVIYKLMNEKSPHSSSNDYRGKYKAEKERVMILERQKHGMEVLLKLVREEYDEYRHTAQGMLADRHRIQGEVFQLEQQIRNLSEAVSSKSSEIELYKQENYIIGREVEQLKKGLREKEQQLRERQREWQRQRQQSNQNSVLLSNQLFSQQLQQLGFELQKKDVQLSELKTANYQSVQKLKHSENEINLLKRQNQQNSQLLKGSTLEQLINLNEQLQKRILQLQTNLQFTHSSERQSVRLHQQQMQGIKQTHSQEIDNLKMDLNLAKQEGSNITRLLELQRGQNDQLRQKIIDYEKVIMDQVRREDMLNQLQRRLRQANQKDDKKTRQIQSLQSTIQKYLVDIKQMADDHEQLQKSLQLHRKIHEEYKQKYRLLEDAFNKKVESLQQKDLQQPFNVQLIEITNIASKYGYEVHNSSLPQWISEQLKDSNELVQANTTLKRTLNALNRQIQDRWIKQKILDMQQIQRLKDLLKSEQNEWKQSRMLDTIRQQSKEDIMMSFESFKQRIAFIKKKLQGLLDKSIVQQNLLESQVFHEDSEEEIDKIISQIKKHIDLLTSKTSTLFTQNQSTKRTFNSFKQTNDELKDQVSELNSFLLQKQQYIQHLLKQKEKSVVKLSSFADVPVEYSLEGESKRSISFKLQSHVFANMESKHELRANIRQKMRLLILQYLPIQQNTIGSAIQDLLVNIYQFYQAPQIIKYFQKFLQDVKLFTSMEQKKQSNIKQVVDELIRQSQELIESQDERQNQFY